MTPMTPPSTDRLGTMRRYRRLYWACLLVAVGGFLAGDFLGYSLIGIAVYWAGVLAMLVVWKGTSLELFDERERTLQRQASDVTLTIFAFVLILGGPGQLVLGEAGYDVPPEFSGAMWGYAALYAVFAAVYVVHRYRS